MLASVGMASEEDEGEAIEEAILIAEAHAIAAAQALHSVTDILANVVYIALQLDKVAFIPERDRSLSRVAEVMRPTDEEHATRLERLKSTYEFRYLSAYVNTTKHRRLVSRGFQISVQEARQFGLRLHPFRYEFNQKDVETFPSRWMDDFLKESLVFISEEVKAIGGRLEIVLRAGA